jgi:hypothetical protein
MTVAGGGGVFVSYRRRESSHLAGRLYDRLVGRFGEDQVFIDVNAIEPGVDFAEEIFRAVAACQVLVAVIGPGWLAAADEQGRRRLDDPDDLVRLEVEAALTRGVRVIPVLTEGAVMPSQHDLPQSLAPLARRNALPVRHDSFRSDTGRLITVIERVLAAPSTAEPSASPGVRPVGNPAGPAAHEPSGPADTSADRAARLLAEAELIARAFTDKPSKVRALSGVARATVATDPDRAAWLLTVAQRAAFLILDKSSKVFARSDVAEAAAVSDPDRAERIASSLTRELVRERALSGIAQAMAATNPDRGERIASSLTREPVRETALSGIAAAVAATDPDRAERIARPITDKLEKALALSGIAQALVASSP